MGHLYLAMSKGSWSKHPLGKIPRIKRSLIRMFSLIEGFSGKRALGFLLKSELCQKRSRFRNDAVLFTWFKQCSACFFPEVCFLFEILRMRKTHFSKAIFWGPFVERKTKEAFCFAKPWSQYNTHVHESPTTASLAQVAKALSGPDSSLFCPDAGSI